MKTLLVSLSAAVALTALAAKFYPVDAPALLGIGFCAGFLGLFAKDYSSAPRYDAVEKRAAVPARRRARQQAPACEPASYIIFNTSAA
jgi:hypothetical protein